MTKPPITFVFKERAAREIDGALAWWAEHVRTSALPDALADAFRLLAQFPEIAPRVASGGRWTTTRRYILDRVGYHLYYDHIPRARRIIVRSLWHERRPKPRL